MEEGRCEERRGNVRREGVRGKTGEEIFQTVSNELDRFLEKTAMGGYTTCEVVPR